MDQIPPDWSVPEFSIDEFFDRRRRYCICVFVINEGDKFLAQLAEMKPLNEELDIIIADGGSTDGSTEPGVLNSHGVKALLTKRGPGRLSAQMRMAFAYAISRGYEGIITIDGNHKDDSSAAPLFIEALDKGYDHVQGSRFIPGGRAIRTPLSRLWAIKLVHAPLVSYSSGFHYTDTTNGFRAYSRRFLLDPRVAPFRECFLQYELHYYLAIQAPRLGYRVVEVPVTRAYPVHGKVPTKISPIQGNWLVLKTLVKVCLHQYDPLRLDDMEGHAK
jgi:glycosyltransferase involved in cell wall biosynthesis